MLSTCKDAREAGFKAGKECFDAGFTYEEGCAAGFPANFTHLNWELRKSPSKNSNPG